jgi:hypothetical protein
MTERQGRKHEKLEHQRTIVFFIGVSTKPEFQKNCSVEIIFKTECTDDRKI